MTRRIPTVFRTLLPALVLALAVTGLLIADSQHSPVQAGITTTIDLSSQRMYVSINGRRAYAWPISSGRRGYRTPTGRFRPTRMHRRYFSRKYHGAPMPYSIFFYGGYAIHGTNHTRALGRPASHGCIRLHPSNARTLFNLVRQHGPRATRIIVRH